MRAENEALESLKRTALFDEHVRAGGRMVPFAGWEMPVQYAGVIPEARAVRGLNASDSNGGCASSGCGVFDVSHMGQLWFEGADASAALNRIVSADWSTLAVGRVAYALLLNEDGGVLDDVMGYRLNESEWLVVVNASRADVDGMHFQKHLDGASMKNNGDRRAMLAIQGPRAATVLQTLTDVDLSQMQWRDCVRATLCAAAGVLARGGYTGSDGFEFMFAADDAPRVWNALLNAGATPCGLGARDVLRLEAALPLYGHELREAWTPAESGVGFAAKTEKTNFIGRDALLQKPQPAQRIRALKMLGKAIPREGYRVLKGGTATGGAAIGEITSGTLSPTLGCGIALATLPAETEIGTEVEIEIRNTTHTAQIVQPPFVPHGRR